MDRLSDKRGFTDFRDEKTILRAGSALLAALQLVGLKRKCGALGEAYNLVTYPSSTTSGYRKHTDKALRMAHFFVPFPYMQYILRQYDGYPLFSPRSANKEAYHASIEPTPSCGAIVKAWNGR